ncbi:MAG: M6 family metalloprotease domain-containing protein, partial [Candidatus Competibacteraceae bacterium]
MDFPDQPHTAAQTTDDVQLKMFGTGSLDDAPYESLRSFYQRSSYGQLNISGNVLGWYRAANPRSYYKNLGYPPGGITALVKEALNYYDAQGHDFTQYDNDGDGVIDAFFIKWTGPDNGWMGFWWAYQSRIDDSSYTIDGKRLGKFVWSWYYNPAWGDVAYEPQVDIHETGHLLGLPDLYDYNYTMGPNGGVGGLDMMDGNWGDHNSFSKFMLEWITPTVVASGSQIKVLNPSGNSADAVLIMPGATAATPFAEFFMAQYRKRNVGNDPNNYPNDGLIIWHVDARLNSAGSNFQYDNSYTEHKLLRLMEADGLEEIEQGIAAANTGDFYLPPKTLGSATVPNSNNYSGQSTEVTVDNLTTPGMTMSARFAVGVACNYAISPISQSFSAVGGSGTVNVTADMGCAWTAATSVNWIAITTGNNGSGNGVVNFTVTTNTSTTQRTGTLTIAGQTFTITQAGSDTYTVTATAGANGSISPASRTVAHGATTTFTVTPSAGYSPVVSGCGGALSGTTYTTGPITAACTVSASFSQQTYTVTATAGANGSISPASRTVAHGATTTFTIAPSAGYSPVVSGCGGTLSGTTYTTGSITAACTVSASFSQQTYAVTAIAGANGSISPASRTVAHGATTTFTVIPSASYSAVVSGCGGMLSGTTYTTGPITAACTVSASFTQQTYAV